MMGRAVEGVDAVFGISKKFRNNYLSTYYLRADQNKNHCAIQTQPNP